MTRSAGKRRPHRRWMCAEIEIVKARYPHERTADIAATLGRPLATVHAKANALGLHKTPAFMASPAACRLRRGDHIGAATQFKPGHVPANKGLRRPGFCRGRMAETQFKKGHFPFNRDANFRVIGALRVNTDGYLDMRTSFERGALGWTALHRILWEDAHGQVPPSMALVFKDGDRLNVCLDNLELISRRELMARNTIQRYPPELRSAIKLARRAERKIREQEHR